jgi:hypothetical protein
MTRRYFGWILAALAGAASSFALTATLGSAEAQRRSAALPGNCNQGDLVVADGGGGFRCESPPRALELGNCSNGDFVSIDGGGLECRGPNSGSWGIRGLLPDCSSNQMLVSEGFGSWRCTDSPLPRCSSGEILVSEGYSGWRCERR